MSVTASPAAQGPSKMFIDGTWADSGDGRTSEAVNPASNTPIGKVPIATKADVDRAVAAARRAFEDPAWRKIDPAERGRLLWRAAQLMRERMDDIVLTETLNNGKTLREAKGDIIFAAWTLEYYAGLADKLEGSTLPVPGARFSYTTREPLGVTAHIAPWNFPLQLAVRSIAPALASGNTVVAKPATYTPLSLLKFAKILEDVGVPKGVFNVVTGGGSVAGAALASHQDIDSITLTGSSGTGEQVAIEAAKNFRPITLELGGKSPNIIFPDADLDKATKGAFYGIFMNAGQMCWAGSRLLIHESIHDEVVQRLVKMAEGWKVGPGTEKDTRMGPLVSRDQEKIVLQYIEAGKTEGAKVAIGGGRAKDAALANGNFVLPTVFTDVQTDMKIAQEEIFGPVLSVLRFRDEADALRLANDTDFGLYAGVWTKDLARAHRFADGIEAGAVCVNEYPITFPQTPFSGWKRSGLGSEQGSDAIRHYTRGKAVIMKLD
ncbi:MAG: aldehyde dehydrogenase family protein [Thermoplasmatota archaeon]